MDRAPVKLIWLSGVRNYSNMSRKILPVQFCTGSEGPKVPGKSFLWFNIFFVQVFQNTAGTEPINFYFLLFTFI